MPQGFGVRGVQIGGVLAISQPPCAVFMAWFLSAPGIGAILPAVQCEAGRMAGLTAAPSVARGQVGCLARPCQVLAVRSFM